MCLQSVSCVFAMCEVEAHLLPFVTTGDMQCILCTLSICSLYHHHHHHHHFWKCALGHHKHDIVCSIQIESMILVVVFILILVSDTVYRND